MESDNSQHVVVEPQPSTQQVVPDRRYWEERLKLLVTEANQIKRLLGQNPHRCPNCGCELK